MKNAIQNLITLVIYTLCAIGAMNMLSGCGPLDPTDDLGNGDLRRDAGVDDATPPCSELDSLPEGFEDGSPIKCPVLAGPCFVYWNESECSGMCSSVPDRENPYPVLISSVSYYLNSCEAVPND